MNIPYLCSLSDVLRASVHNLGQSAKDKIENIVQGTVEEIDKNEEISSSLKNGGFPHVARPMRQINIRGDGPDPIFKCFVLWDRDLKQWHVLMEMADETFWEDKYRPAGKDN